jgi:hypothetical protein
VPLTQEQINFQAQKASWYVEVDNRRAVDGGDVYVITGDGVDDLNRLLDLMPTLRVATYRIDTGTQYDAWVPCNVADIQAIKTAFIQFYGTVSKPGFPVFDRKFMKLAGPQVQIQVQP